jgi:hypothetical protein
MADYCSGQQAKPEHIGWMTLKQTYEKQRQRLGESEPRKAAREALG